MHASSLPSAVDVAIRTSSTISAGVDCSDHEVNIKILLSQIESGGELTRKQRNVLLVEMTEDVAGLVLRDNYLQSQAITVSQRRRSAFDGPFGALHSGARETRHHGSQTRAPAR